MGIRMIRRIFVLFFLVAALQGLYLPSARSEAENLSSLAKKYNTDKGPAGHYYTKVYELMFGPMKQSTKKIYEIGILGGASLRMWADYFPQANVYGIDIEDRSNLNSERIHTFVADQAERAQLQKSIDAFGSDYDIIVDDGGHTMKMQQISFAYLFPHVKRGGFYVIEDVHTSLMPSYNGWDWTNRTLAMIDRFIRSGEIQSKYMTKEEKAALNRGIDYVNLVSLNQGRSIMAIFKKK